MHKGARRHQIAPDHWQSLASPRLVAQVAALELMVRQQHEAAAQDVEVYTQLRARAQRSADATADVEAPHVQHASKQPGSARSAWGAVAWTASISGFGVNRPPSGKRYADFVVQVSMQDTPSSSSSFKEAALGGGAAADASRCDRQDVASAEEGPSEVAWTVRRRFSQFVWLRDRCQELSPSIALPALPKKTWFQSLDINFLNERAEALSHWLAEVAATSVALQRERPEGVSQHEVLAFQQHVGSFLIDIDARGSELAS